MKTAVKEIAEIRLSCLSQLFLSSNKIESIEGLSRVWMPYVNIIALGIYQNMKMTIKYTL